MKKTRYVFQVDGRDCGLLREKWEDAAQDAVNSEMAMWDSLHSTIRWDASGGGSICKVITHG